MMANKSNHQFNNEFVRDLLSPYLDNEVSEEERTLVEQALSASPALNKELETLRQTVANISALPYIPAPRPFTLSEVDVLPSRPSLKSFFRLPIWVGGLTTVTAVLLGIVVISFFTIGYPFNPSPTNAPIAHITLDKSGKEANSNEHLGGTALSMTHPTTEVSGNAIEGGTVEAQSLEEQGSNPATSASPNSPLIQTLQQLPVWWVFLSGLTLGMLLLTGVVTWRTIQNKQ